MRIFAPGSYNTLIRERGVTMDFYSDAMYCDDGYCAGYRQDGLGQPFGSFQGPISGRPPRPRPSRPQPPFFPPAPPVIPRPDGSQGIRRCLNRVTLIWLRSGQRFWFYIDEVNPDRIRGFRWTRTGWVRDRIWRRNILRFDCQS